MANDRRSDRRRRGRPTPTTRADRRTDPTARSPPSPAGPSPAAPDDEADELGPRAGPAVPAVTSPGGAGGRRAASCDSCRDGSERLVRRFAAVVAVGRLERFTSRRWSPRPRTTTSSSSEAGPRATPPLCTARPPVSTSPWSRRPRSAAPASTWGASLPRSCSRRPPCGGPSPAPPLFGLTTDEPTLDFAVTQQRKQQVIDGLFNGLSGLLKRRKVTVYDGIGTPARRPPGDDHRRRVGRRRGHRRPTCCSPRARCRAPSPASTSTAAASSPPTSCCRCRSSRPSAVVIGGGAIGCEFASMMSDLGTEVTILEALPKILPGCDDDVTNVVVLKSFKDRGIDVRTGVSVNGHEPHDHDGGTKVLLRRRRVHRRRDRGGVGRSSAAVGRTSASTAPRSRSTSGASSRSTTGAAPPSRASTPSATSSPPPPSPTSASPRPSSSSRTSSARTRCRSTTARSRGASTATPRSAFVGHTEDSAKEAGFDVIVTQAPLRRQRPGAHPR